MFINLRTKVNVAPDSPVNYTLQICCTPRVLFKNAKKKAVSILSHHKFNISLMPYVYLQIHNIERKEES